MLDSDLQERAAIGKEVGDPFWLALPSPLLPSPPLPFPSTFDVDRIQSHLCWGRGMHVWDSWDLGSRVVLGVHALLLLPVGPLRVQGLRSCGLAAVKLLGSELEVS